MQMEQAPPFSAEPFPPGNGNNRRLTVAASFSRSPTVSRTEPCSSLCIWSSQSREYSLFLAGGHDQGTELTAITRAVVQGVDEAHKN